MLFVQNSVFGKKVKLEEWKMEEVINVTITLTVFDWFGIEPAI